MKRLLILVSALAISACSQAEETEPEAPVETAAPEPAEPLAADGKASYGMYRVTTQEGEVFMEDVKADGTYVATKDGEVVETGTWDQPSPDQYCSKVDEEYIDEDNDGTRQCNTEQIGADGVWTSVNSKGETATVERVEG